MSKPCQKTSLNYFDVSKLAGVSVDETGKNTRKGHFQELASKLMSEQWKRDGTVSEKWTTVRSALTEAASLALGREKHRHPDWLRENADSLEPILRKRNRLYLKWLGSGVMSDKQNFSRTRSEARRAVRAAKNAWFGNSHVYRREFKTKDKK